MSYINFNFSARCSGLKLCGGFRTEPNSVSRPCRTAACMFALAARNPAACNLVKHVLWIRLVLLKILELRLLDNGIKKLSDSKTKELLMAMAGDAEITISAIRTEFENAFMFDLSKEAVKQKWDDTQVVLADFEKDLELISIKLSKV